MHRISYDFASHRMIYVSSAGLRVLLMMYNTDLNLEKR